MPSTDDYKKIEEYFINNKNYYSFEGDKGCFGYLKYDSKDYFAVSGSNNNLYPNDENYDNTHRVIDEIIKDNPTYENAKLGKNAVTFYLEYDGKNAFRNVCVTDKYKDLEYLTMVDFFEKEIMPESFSLFRQYSVFNCTNPLKNSLFDCVERAMISYVEDDFDTFSTSKKNCEFVIKYAPCPRCQPAVKGKYVFYYYENRSQLIRDYDNGRLDFTKLHLKQF